MASKDIPSLSQVFGRLRQATLFDSSTTTPVPSGDTSAFASSMGSGRGGRGGQGRWSRGREQWGGGRGRGHAPCKYTYCHGENHAVDFYWELYGKSSAHQASLQVEELTSQSLPPTSRVVSILEEVYNHHVSMHSNSVSSNSTATLAQQGTFTAYLATKEP